MNSFVYVAYCALCDAGWASRDARLAEKRAQAHAEGGILTAKLNHLVEIIEVAVPAGIEKGSHGLHR